MIMNYFVTKKILNIIPIFIGVFFILGSDELISPEITILGDNPLTIIVNTEYSDPGAIASDNIDGEVEVVSKISVDTSKIGNYSVTYTAVDSQDNEAIAVRNVHVISITDIDPPIIKDLNKNEIGKDYYLKYLISDANSGLNKETIKVKMNNRDLHPDDVNYVDNELRIRRNFFRDIKKGFWDLGELEIIIEVADNANNKVTKKFNYTVLEINPLETIEVKISVNSIIVGPDNINFDFFNHGLVDFSFSAISNAPIIRYEWTVSSSIGGDFNISKEINESKVITMDTYTHSEDYTDTLFNKYSRSTVLIKVTNSIGHYGFAYARIFVD